MVTAVGAKSVGVGRGSEGQDKGKTNERKIEFRHLVMAVLTDCKPSKGDGGRAG